MLTKDLISLATEADFESMLTGRKEFSKEDTETAAAINELADKNQHFQKFIADVCGIVLMAASEAKQKNEPEIFVSSVYSVLLTGITMGVNFTADILERQQKELENKELENKDVTHAASV